MAGINRQEQLKKTGTSVTYNEILKLRAARVKEYSIKGIYKYGYRNKEDISNLPQETLVVGSQNVLTNAAEQIAIRNGYQLDGPAGDQNTYGVDSSYDFNTHSLAGVQNLRKWGTTLEVRYQNPVTQAISWITLLNTLSATNVANFTNFWDTTSLKNYALFVNGNLNVYKWSGAVGSFASDTSNSITLQGTGSLANLNFDSGSAQLLINGVTYSYTAAGFTSATTYTQTPTNNQVAIDASHWTSQLITTGATATELTTVVLKTAISTGFSGTYINGYLYTDNAGVPGTIVGLYSGTVIGITGDVNVTFTLNQAVSPNTNYHWVVTTPYLSTDSSVSIKVYTGNNGSAGTNSATPTPFQFPSSWSNQNGYLNMTVTENDQNSMTFTGVVPDPTSVTINVGDAVVQGVAIGASTVTGCSLTEFDLIDNLSNQIYYGSFIDNTIFVSKTNNFLDTTFSTPRLPGEGAKIVIDAPPTAFRAQATQMYISSGRSAWWRTAFTLSADLTKESLNINPLQTATNQGTQSQALIGKLKNSIIFVSNETIINAFGPVKNILGDPNFVNMSDPIKYDIDAYDFTGGSIYYFNYFVYVTLPAMGIERLYNVVKKYWEAPQVVPFSRHYEVDGVLFAHSGLTNESYQCYVPGLYSDNGNPINMVIAFPYVSQEGGAANQLKNFNKHYTEGYIAANTTMLLTINYDFGGFTGTYTTTITGTEANIIFNKVTDGSIGQNTLGSEPIGSILNLANQPPIPKFRIINTFPRVDCFEYQIVFSTDDVDQNVAILRSGPAVAASDNLAVKISV